MSLILRNGQTWENQKSERAITQWLGGDAWCLLGLPVEMPGGGTCMLPIVDEHGFSVFPLPELTRRLQKNHWRRIPHFGMQLEPAQEEAARREFAASIAAQCAELCESAGDASAIREKFKA